MQQKYLSEKDLKFGRRNFDGSPIWLRCETKFFFDLFCCASCLSRIVAPSEPMWRWAWIYYTTRTRTTWTSACLHSFSALCSFSIVCYHSWRSSSTSCMKCGLNFQIYWPGIIKIFEFPWPLFWMSYVVASSNAANRETGCLTSPHKRGRICLTF